MKKIIFDVSDDMFKKIDDSTVREGFISRSEFLRFLIITYFKENKVRAADAIIAANNSDEELIDGHPPEDFEFGIPLDVIEKIKEKARLKAESERRMQS